MSIQRYEPCLEWGFAEDEPCESMCERDDGDYVLYTAHAAEVERLTAERDALQSIVNELSLGLGVTEEHVVSTVKEDYGKYHAVIAERDAAVARAEKAEADAAQFCAGLCVHPSGVIGDDGGSACCPITGTRDARTVQAAPSDRERRLMAALLAADELVDVMQFPASVTELFEALRNRVCLLRHEMRDPDSIKAAENAMNAFSELSGAIFSCGIGSRDKAIKNYEAVRAALSPEPLGGPEGEE